jgi:hypothetical protein
VQEFWRPFGESRISSLDRYERRARHARSDKHDCNGIERLRKDAREMMVNGAAFVTYVAAVALMIAVMMSCKSARVIGVVVQASLLERIRCVKRKQGHYASDLGNQEKPKQHRSTAAHRLPKVHRNTDLATIRGFLQHAITCAKIFARLT